MRDTLIDTAYEGTTAIQAQDFCFREIVRDRRCALDHLADRIGAFLTIVSPTDDLATEERLLATVLDDVRAMVGTLTANHQAADSDPTQVYKVGLGSVRLLYAIGDLLLGWLLLKQAAVANMPYPAMPRGMRSITARSWWHRSLRRMSCQN